MFEDLRRQYVNLAQPRLGSEVVYATDDFFADKARLIDPAEPVFIPGIYDENGKWMDGWESRRKRAPGHDWCVVRLGVPGRVAGFEIDTRHFTGNYPPGAEILVCRSDDEAPDEQAGWTKVTDGSLALAVTVEGDPGRDLGQARQPGHRFFFSVDEVEPLGSAEASAGLRARFFSMPSISATS